MSGWWAGGGASARARRFGEPQVPCLDPLSDAGLGVDRGDWEKNRQAFDRGECGTELISMQLVGGKPPGTIGDPLVGQGHENPCDVELVLGSLLAFCIHKRRFGSLISVITLGLTDGICSHLRGPAHGPMTGMGTVDHPTVIYAGPDGPRFRTRRASPRPKRDAERHQSGLQDARSVSDHPEGERESESIRQLQVAEVNVVCGPGVPDEGSGEEVAVAHERDQVGVDLICRCEVELGAHVH